MLKAKFDIHDLTRSASEIGRLVPADDLFSWLARSVTVPGGWVALALRTGMDPLLRLAGERCEADDVSHVLFVRSARFECSAQHESVQSSDGFLCLGRITLPVRVLPEVSELDAFH